MNTDQRIVKLVQDEYQRATRCLLHAVAKHAGVEASADAWDKAKGAENIEANPYRQQINFRKEEIDRCRKEVEEWSKALERVTNTFLETTWNDRYKIAELSKENAYPTMSIRCYDMTSRDTLYDYICKNFFGM